MDFYPYGPMNENHIKKDKHTQNLLFCEKILTSYVLCIHKFTIEHKDCNQIQRVLSNLELCNKEHKNVPVDRY